MKKNKKILLVISSMSLVFVAYLAFSTVHVNLIEKKSIKQWHSQEMVLTNKIRNDPDNMDLYIDLSKVYFYQNNFKMAEIAINKAIAINPNIPDAYRWKILILFQKEELVKSIELGNKSIEMFPNDMDLHVILGTIYDSIGNYSEEIKILSNYKKIINKQENELKDSTYSMLAKKERIEIDKKIKKLEKKINH